MKKLLTFVAVFSLFGCLNEEELQQKRLKSASLANEWLQQNKIEGTVTCNYPSPIFCDVIPKDPRPHITLLCNNSVCRISE